MEINNLHLNMMVSKFGISWNQGIIFRCHVIFKEGKWVISTTLSMGI